MVRERLHPDLFFVVLLLFLRFVVERLVVVMLLV